MVSYGNGDYTLFNTKTNEAIQIPSEQEVFRNKSGKRIISSFRYPNDPTPFVLVASDIEDGKIFVKKAAEVEGIYHTFFSMPPGPSMDAFMAYKDAGKKKLGLKPALATAKVISGQELAKRYENQISMKLADLAWSFQSLQALDTKSPFAQWRDYGFQIDAVKKSQSELKQNSFKYNKTYFASESKKMTTELNRLYQLQLDVATKRKKNQLPEYSFDSKVYDGQIFQPNGKKSETFRQYAQRLADSCYDIVNQNSNINGGKTFLADLKSSLAATAPRETPNVPAPSAQNR